MTKRDAPPANASVETNRHWWNSLTPAQREEVIAKYPEMIGNRDGVPVEARDAANRNRLPGMIIDAETHQQTVAAQYGTNSDQYKAATLKLDELKKVEEAAKNPEGVKPDQRRYLMMVDTTTGRQTRAAVSVGNPDKSSHVSVTTPGRTTTVGSLPGMVGEAENLQSEARRQLDLQGKDDSVAAISWIGYDPPLDPQGDGIGDIIDAGVDTGTTDRAAEGAKTLNQFYNGLEASHEGVQAPHITAVGHSYGSLTTGLALQGGEHPVTDMVVYGSPGIGANSPAELGLDNGRAYVMRADDDPIKWTQDGPRIAEWAPAAAPLASAVPIPGSDAAAGGLAGVGVGVDSWQDNNNGGFGSDPARNPSFVQLDTRDQIATDGTGHSLPGAHGHSDYPRGTGRYVDGVEIPRVSTYNTAAVIAGLPENVIRAPS
ncbi:alpha/beta hydrolase [Nocardia sp. NPDC058705]|uniref:alpha/beta hydrolase n=1 Tax=Nocardia sp. NPDC058705 TaxID=3346609 RepID=UPI0036A1BE5B